MGVEALIDFSRCNSTGDVCEDVVVRRHTQGHVRMLYGSDVAIDVEALGCSGADSPAQVAECFLSGFGDMFGGATPGSHLEHRDTATLKSGATVVQFDQVAAGLKVYGSGLTLVIAPSGEVTVVASTLRDISYLPSEADADAQLGQLPHWVVDGTVAYALEMPEVELVPDGEYIYVDPDTWVGIPSFAFRVFEPGGIMGLFRVLVDAVTGEVLQQEDTRNYAWPRAKYYGTMLHPNVKHGVSCLSSANCPTGYVCQRYIPGLPPHAARHDYLRPNGTGACVRLCQNDGDCATGFRCQVTTPTSLGYCIDDPNLGGMQLTTFYDTDNPSNDHWYGGERLTMNVMHQHIREGLDRLVTWHKDDLGVTSSMFPYSYRLNAIAACNCGLRPPASICEENEGCGGAHQCNVGGEEGICLYNIRHDFVQNFNDNEPFRGPSTPGNIAHEFTHVLLGAYYGASPHPDTGLRESLPEVFARLHTKYYWLASPWGDQEMGLNPSGIYPLPYALRSRFDWFETNPASTHTVSQECSSWEDCAPYHWCESGPSRCTTNNNAYQNREMWWRFLRILAAGKSDFPNEDLFTMAYSGIGVALTQQIVHDAAYLYRSFPPGGTLQDWIDSLIAAGNTYGQAWAVRFALGLVGFFPYDYAIEGGAIQTNREPMDIHFAAYTHSTNKVFTAYRDSGTGGVSVRYYVGSTATVKQFANSTTSDRPAVVEYAGKLYVFWRNASDNSIRYAFLNQGFTPPMWSGPTSLGSLGLVTNGAFTATAFNGKLTLAFVHPTDELPKIATCSSNLNCMYGYYDQYGTPYFKYISGLTYQVRPGLSAVAAANVNGEIHGPGELLYIAHARKSDSRINVMRLSPSLSLLGSTSITTTYPYKWRTYRPLGLRVRKSAFAAAGNYLYLTFVADDNLSIYTTVLQNYSGGTRSYTRPVDTFRKVQSGHGVAWVIGSAYDTSDSYFLSYARNGLGRRLVGYGRY